MLAIYSTPMVNLGLMEVLIKQLYHLRKESRLLRQPDPAKPESKDAP